MNKTAAPKRKRVSIHSDRRMVSLQGEVIPVTGEPRALLGWTQPPYANVLCVTLDDGSNVLVSARHVTEEQEEAPDTQRDGATP